MTPAPLQNPGQYWTDFYSIQLLLLSCILFVYWFARCKFSATLFDLLSVDLFMCVCLYATLNLTKGLWVRVIVSNREPIEKCVWRVDW